MSDPKIACEATTVRSEDIADISMKLCETILRMSQENSAAMEAVEMIREKGAPEALTLGQVIVTAGLHLLFCQASSHKMWIDPVMMVAENVFEHYAERVTVLRRIAEKEKKP